MKLKPISWVGGARESILRFPKLARQRAGYELYLVQTGQAPSNYRPMATVGPGVVEIRIHAGQDFRVLYVAKFPESIYVLHAFEKKTRRTARRDLQLGRARYRAILEQRKGD